jgi:hypothetical protein
VSRRRPLRDGRRPVGLSLVLAAGLAVATGCTGPGADQAAQVADSFQRIVGDDPARACDLLAPGTRDEVEKSADKECSEALGDAELPDPSPLQSVDVYGKDAIVHFANDTIFLARYPDGWRVTAAGCRPGPNDEKPYDCDVKGD